MESSMTDFTVGGKTIPTVSAAEFRRRPLECLDRLFPQAGDAFWVPGGQLIVAEPQAAKDILSDSGGLYHDHSDFFHTRRGTFGPREVQATMGRAFRGLLQAHIDSRRDVLARSLQRLRSTTSEWPDAGNRLIFELLVQALVGGGAREEEDLLRDIVERAVLAGALKRHGRLSRAFFRRRVTRTLSRAIRRRRQQGNRSPTDLLGAVVQAADDAASHGDEADRNASAENVSDDDLGEVLLSALFATVGSVGFTLGWCLYLLGTRATSEASPAWVVREALRLWPIAWMLARRPLRPLEVLGQTVTPDDHVVVCPYLLHRHPEYWPEPSRFLPQRWAAGQPSPAYLPFGWGPHFCAAASLTLNWVEDILHLVLETSRPLVTTHQPGPQVGPALAPPKYSLSFEPRSASLTVSANPSLACPERR